LEKVKVENRSVGVAACVIAGALVNGKPNYITLGSFGGMSIDPPVVYISINKSHYTNPGVKENGYFSVNIPSGRQAKETDYCGIVSGRDADKSKVFKTFYGNVKKAPMAEECPVNLLCRLIQTVDLPKNEVFIGIIEEAYVSKDCLTDGKPDVAKTNPIVLAGGKYCEVGKAVGAPWEIGKTMIK
jgi:flavin reductase (DIM6/NTAB) family NADH-FMN oxidoreductase RutF